MNRRDFLKPLLLGVMGPLGGLALPSLSQAGTHKSAFHRRLILVELAGANDGLNTLVPFDNDYYHRLRPNLGLKSADTLSLFDDLALHRALTPLMPVWESGQMAWVQGLGYPKPNRSHFTSISYWETAGDGVESKGAEGWMTHAVEHRLGRQLMDPHGISLAGDMDIFNSESGRWLSMTSSDQFKTLSLPTVAMTDVKSASLALVQSRMQTLNVTLQRLSQKVADAPVVPGFRAGALGEQLRQVCQLIAADIDTPVYRVRLSGFDTHQNQLRRHQRLLNSLAVGLSQFVRELKKMNEWNNTLVMSYSEFGRRAAENESAGTDHGTAAPHFVMGGRVNGGIKGSAPDLAVLTDGDPEHTMDYRALYQAILQQGLQANTTDTALQRYTDKRLQQLLVS